MLRSLIPTLAIVSSACLAAAMPSLPRNADEIAPFSFENWVNDIVSDPEGSHLTPEEAIEAYFSSGHENSRSLDKRVTCRDDSGDIKSANVPDAVACINYLASLGDTPCNVRGATTLCSIGGAEITGVAGGGASDTSDTCQNVARSAGKIMDKCTRADNTVNGSELSWNQKHMMVHISGP